jgi:phosphohistidine phosphatase SixA
MRITAIFVLLMLLGPPSASADHAAAMWAALRDGGRVALIRHTAAPGGSGDPPGFRLDDCATQRNLSERGRSEARALGAQFRAMGVTVGKLLSSQWCRCVDTATLMDIGPVEIAPTLNNAFVLRDRRDELTAGARALIAAWKGPSTLVVVTHGANVQALTGRAPAEGEIVVVTPDASGKAGFSELGRITPGH